MTPASAAKPIELGHNGGVLQGVIDQFGGRCDAEVMRISDGFADVFFAVCTGRR